MKSYEYLAEQALAGHSDAPQEDRIFAAVSDLFCAAAHLRDGQKFDRKEKDEVGCAMILALAYALFKDPEDQEEALVTCLEEFLAEKGGMRNGNGGTSESALSDGRKGAV